MRLYIKISILVFNLTLISLLVYSFLEKAIPDSRDYQTFRLVAITTLILSSVVLYFKRIRLSKFRKYEWSQTGVESKAGQKSYIYTNSEIITFVSDIVLLGYTFWVLITLMPLPHEPGIILFASLIGVAPVVNLLALLCCRIQS